MRDGNVRFNRLLVMGTLVTTLVACSDDDGKETASADTFCQTARAAEESVTAQQELFAVEDVPTPQSVQPVAEQFAANVGAMAAAAPAEIRAEANVMNSAAQQLLDVVRSNGFDVATLIDKPEFIALTETLTSPEFENAQKAVGDYAAAKCGVGDTSGG